MSRTTLILLAAGGSAAMLAGAFGFQYIGGLPPCELCLWQRWPHAAAIVIGALALMVRGVVLPLLGAAAALTTGALGVYHTGVERKWWPGPTSCTGSGDGLSGLSGSDLLNFDAAPKVVMCDQVAWQMLGLSMASWNALAAFAFALLWVLAARASLRH
ncbi:MULTISPECIES: disulfide bond formation protein B [Actibacterium]|uniref:Disulfide bond formation protein DsbB n=1 Tax=Actibacterium naphthalenivorans TaxID=1614693 RepID=A0A840CAP3_9RHOB|nr:MULTISPECIES: disulfide bond formation protein B [Actibacterium]ALG90249.1 dihydroneopterin aldolase [Actibacterium sp. EMB200-NS6]MBB4022150.1 disulfide bond formation protein DsbB [Actibacterium naphthalenivorans]